MGSEGGGVGRCEQGDCGRVMEGLDGLLPRAKSQKPSQGRCKSHRLPVYGEQEDVEKVTGSGTSPPPAILPHDRDVSIRYEIRF